MGLATGNPSAWTARLKSLAVVPIGTGMEARLRVVSQPVQVAEPTTDQASGTPVLPTWPPGRRRRDPEEWRRVLDDIGARREAIAGVLAEAQPASSDALDDVLERLHERRPGLLAHARRVARYVAAAARELGVPSLARFHVERAGLIHDLGKLALPEALKASFGPFTAQELMVVRSHSTIGAELAHRVPYLRTAAPLVAATHERYGGGGHPAGCAGDAIPLGARLIAVADAWDAFAGAPEDRDAAAIGGANLELVRHAGSHFDPSIVRAWLRISETCGC
jgi:putative nucleotidyltransferase with HDIG domain